MKITTTGKGCISLGLSGDNFLAYHRVVAVYIPITVHDTLSITLSTSATVSGVASTKEISKTGSCVVEDACGIVTEIHIVLDGGTFYAHLYDSNNKELVSRRAINLKEIK